MAKKVRKAAASKTRKVKASAGRKRPAAKTLRKGRRKAATATPKRAKSVAKKSVAKKTAKKKAARKRIAKQPESFLQKVEGAVEAVLDTLTDAERLHRKLEPDISREPE